MNLGIALGFMAGWLLGLVLGATAMLLLERKHKKYEERFIKK